MAEITESSTLKMHSVMMSTRPSLIFWNGVTVELMHVLTALRKEGIGVCYTMDAGPQVKAICLPEHAERVEEAMRSVRGAEDLIITGCGDNALRVFTFEEDGEMRLARKQAGAHPDDIDAVQSTHSELTRDEATRVLLRCRGDVVDALKSVQATARPVPQTRGEEEAAAADELRLSVDELELLVSAMAREC